MNVLLSNFLEIEISISARRYIRTRALLSGHKEHIRKHWYFVVIYYIKFLNFLVTTFLHELLHFIACSVFNLTVIKFSIDTNRVRLNKHSIRMGGGLVRHYESPLDFCYFNMLSSDIKNIIVSLAPFVFILSLVTYSYYLYISAIIYTLNEPVGVILNALLAVYCSYVIPEFISKEDLTNAVYHFKCIKEDFKFSLKAVPGIEYKIFLVALCITLL